MKEAARKRAASFALRSMADTVTDGFVAGGF
jgi:hypothetical protein